MEVVETNIEGVKLIRPRIFGDDRGAFVETYSRGRYLEAGIDVDFVQDNHVLSRRKGTVRGLHFQTPPHAQAKLVWVVRGAIFDVALDLRRGSPTFGRHHAFELKAETSEQVFIPVGFAHGYCTLEPDTEVAYKVSVPYAPDHEGGILWSDPALGVDWPVAAGGAVVSEKDRNLPRLDQLPEIF